MNKSVWFAVVAVIFGISACSDSSLPTSAERDLLQNPSASPDLGTSKYGQALVDNIGITPIPYAVDPLNPVDPIPYSDTARQGYMHITEGEHTSKYRPRYSEHIKDDHNRSMYKPNDYEHIKTGGDQSKYKPTGHEHYNGPRTVDKTKYIPSGYQHNASGPNETRYSSGGVGME